MKWLKNVFRKNPLKEYRELNEKRKRLNKEIKQIAERQTEILRDIPRNYKHNDLHYIKE
jgi:Na+/phosphate symporter